MGDGIVPGHEKVQYTLGICGGNNVFGYILYGSNFIYNTLLTFCIRSNNSKHIFPLSSEYKCNKRSKIYNVTGYYILKYFLPVYIMYWVIKKKATTMGVLENKSNQK